MHFLPRVGLYVLDKSTTLDQNPADPDEGPVLGGGTGQVGIASPAAPLSLTWQDSKASPPHKHLADQRELSTTGLLLGVGVGALVGGIVLCPALSGSDASCIGWVITGGLLGALVGSVR
jgi:hypothetical protein